MSALKGLEGRPLELVLCSLGAADSVVDDVVCALPGAVVHIDGRCPDHAAVPTAADVWLVLADQASWWLAGAKIQALRGAHAHAAIVVVASQVSAAGLEQLMALGAIDFVHHPLASDELGVRIRRALSQRSLAPPAEPFQTARAKVVADFERDYIERLLHVSEGNISHAARLAHKNRRAFFELIRKHGIDADRYRMTMA